MGGIPKYGLPPRLCGSSKGEGEGREKGRGDMDTYTMMTFFSLLLFTSGTKAAVTICAETTFT